jgi:hypothetical protein
MVSGLTAEERAVNAEQLRDWVEQPETHRKLVGDYAGSYALGVSEDPPALLLRVEPGDTSSFPSKVTLHGVEVPVIVEGNYRPARPLNVRR